MSERRPGEPRDVESRLTESEERLRAVVENAVDGVVVIDDRGTIEAFNPAAERLFGYAAIEVVGKNVRMLMPEPYRAQHDGYLANYLSTGVRKIIGIGREVVGQRRDGSVFPMDLAVSEMRIRDARKFTGLVRDITERKRQFEALAAARADSARYRTLVDSVQDYAIVLLDAQGTVASWNRGAERIKGYRAAEIIGKTIAVFYPPEDRLRGSVEEALAEATRLGRAEREGWRVRKDGGRFWASVVLTALRDEDGRVTGFAKVTRDLTERRRAEAELRDREVRLRTLVETTADGIIVFNSQGRIESFNPAAERLFGYRAEEVRNRDVRLLDATGEAPGFNGNLAALRGEGTGKCKDGSTFPMEVALSVMTMDHERFVTAIVRDVTARRQAEEEQRRLNSSLTAQVDETSRAMARLRETQAQLIQTEKLASLGGMVAGVAHEVNTPLGVAVTAASALQLWLDRLRKSHAAGSVTLADFEEFLANSGEAAAVVLHNLNRAADLVRSFKEIAVDQTSDERRAIRIDEYVGETIASLQPQVKKTPHTISVECAEGLLADTYPGAIAQILTNLVTNSLVHAWPDGRPGKMRIQAVPHEGGVRLVYADDGDGIPAANLPRVFDPFFTTRRGKGGSGLGLHIVHNLVTQRLGGRIDVESPPGAGTQFTLWLPLTAPLPRGRAGVGKTA